MAILILFAAIVIIIFNNEPNAPAATVRTATIICIAIIGVCVLLLAVAIRLDSVKRNLIHFAVFEGYLMILPLKSAKDAGYISIPYADIVKYTFEADCTYSSDDTSNLFPHYLNYGILKIFTRDAEYKTQIANIVAAREWLTKFVSIA